MINPDELQKRYYKIGEVAKMFDVAPSLIRFWEEEFTQLKPAKTKSGIRKFQKDDILILNRIYALVKIQGFKLKGAKLALRKKSTAENKSAGPNKQTLNKIKRELIDLRNEMTKLKEHIK